MRGEALIEEIMTARGNTGQGMPDLVEVDDSLGITLRIPKDARGKNATHPDHTIFAIKKLLADAVSSFGQAFHAKTSSSESYQNVRMADPKGSPLLASLTADVRPGLFPRGSLASWQAMSFVLEKVDMERREGDEWTRLFGAGLERCGEIMTITDRLTSRSKPYINLFVGHAALA
jgi:hypothetical protein